jgi:hypothetical protein
VAVRGVLGEAGVVCVGLEEDAEAAANMAFRHRGRKMLWFRGYVMLRVPQPHDYHSSCGRTRLPCHVP